MLYINVETLLVDPISQALPLGEGYKKGQKEIGKKATKADRPTCLRRGPQSTMGGRGGDIGPVAAETEKSILAETFRSGLGGAPLATPFLSVINLKNGCERDPSSIYLVRG